MAMVACPECGKEISDKAVMCPHCGYPLRTESKTADSNKQADVTKQNKIAIAVVACIAMFGIFFVFYNTNSASSKGTSSAKTGMSTYSGSSSYYSGSSGSGSKVNSSTIFNNLSISNFSVTATKYDWTIRCQVKNNNAFTINGYIYANFYDRSGNLLYNHLIQVTAVGSGETVTCSAYIPKNNGFDGTYDSVKFTQANLVKTS